jgi:hypothetical protein
MIAYFIAISPPPLHYHIHKRFAWINFGSFNTAFLLCKLSMSRIEWQDDYGAGIAQLV